MVAKCCILLAKNAVFLFAKIAVFLLAVYMVAKNRKLELISVNVFGSQYTMF